MIRRLLPLALAASCAAVCHPLVAQDSTVAIRGATILTCAGETIENGIVVFAGGRIQAVGGATTPIPDGAEIVEWEGDGFVSPGLVDASAQIGVRESDANEQGDEVTPQMRILDAVDRDDPRFARVRARGVTTVHLSPGNRNVIGGLGAVLKTWGTSVSDMLVKDGASLRMAMGSEPSAGNRAIRGGMPNSMYSRRPTTRMGVVWAVRKAFYDAKDYELTIDPNNPSTPDPGMEVLKQALNKQLLVHTTARAEQDIRTALRLAEEFGYKPVLDDPVEAWRAIDEIAASGAAVLFGAPSATSVAGYGARDGAEVRFNTLTLLAERNVPFAITTGTNAAALPLVAEATFAVRHGLDPDTALEAVTIVPARILDVAARVGSIERGKDADLVLWSGHPLDPTSRAIAVFVGGQRSE